MKTYTTQQLRNVSLAGHSGSGKTTLAEALLFQNGMIQRVGTVEQGNTQSDYDPEEISRRMSINATLLPIELPEHKINLLDCPGSRDFVGETKNAIRVSEMCLLVVDSVAGPQVGTEFAWDFATDYLIPKAFFVNKMDVEHANFDEVIRHIDETFDAHCVPVSLPIGKGSAFKGVIDLLEMKAIYDENGKVTEGEIPAEYLEAARAARRKLVEAAAEGDDELTEKFLMEETLSREEIILGLREDLFEGRFSPVACGSATKRIGLSVLQKFLLHECPSPDMRKGIRALDEDDEVHFRTIDPNAPFSALVFKTVNDDYAGRMSLIKVVTGKVAGDCQLLNSSNGKVERVGHVFELRGKAHLNVESIMTGDIGAFAKLESTHTGDTLIDPKAPVVKYKPTRLPQPTSMVAVAAKNRGDEDKISIGLHRLLESDMTLRLERDASLHQSVLKGMGDTHLDVAAARLKAMAKVELELKAPRVPYRETLTRIAKGQGKFKRQSGGRGQYGDCWIRLEPLPRGSGFEFVWEIVGGVIPTNFKASVEKGLREAITKGILAGFPAVDVRACCYDGSYHDVDSSDMAFQVAASLAWKNVAPNSGPVILEPYNTVTCDVPQEYMGDVLGYMSQCRGRISGNETVGRRVRIVAEVPMREMGTFSRDLRSMTQGRGVFESTFSHYEMAPPPIQEKIIANEKVHHAEAEH